MPRPDVAPFLDETLHTFSYVVADPATARPFTGHDHEAAGREVRRCETTVEKERCHELQVREGIEEERSVAPPRARDAELGSPRPIVPPEKTDMRAGRLPEPEADGVSRPRIPPDRS